MFQPLKSHRNHLTQQRNSSLTNLTFQVSSIRKASEYASVVDLHAVDRKKDELESWPSIDEQDFQEKSDIVVISKTLQINTSASITNLNQVTREPLIQTVPDK